MTDNRRLQLMQEALDENLSPEEENELYNRLQDEPETAEQFDKLQQVENLLRTAPHERAPERLALTIMARIAQVAQQGQLAAELEGEPDELQQAMMQVALSLVTVSTMPLLVGTSWMLLHARTDPKKLDYVFEEVATFYLLVIDVMKVMLEEAEAAYSENPEAALAMLSLMPVTLLELVKVVLEVEEDGDPEDA